jgi:hypothetical protein
MGVSAGQDLDSLWAQVQANHELDTEDAVLLLDSREVTLDASGNLATRVHRVVWIGTAIGIRGYADLRVPWNTTTSELDVEILRTWREGRWWPDPSSISETAVVPTLPYAVNHADDYTVMRETMLLHDGVELPCIMETAYTITTKGQPGTDGLWVIPQRDPSVLTQLEVTVPSGTTLKHEELNRAPAVSVFDDGTTAVYTWSMEYVAGLALPLTGAPAVHEPSVVWSTWQDWGELRDHWRGVFDQAAVLDTALNDSLEVWLEDAPTPWSRIGAVVDAVNRDVRAVHYPTRHWRYAPRPALRTWETAYGHSLDRAVLAAALLRGAGYEVTPIFVGTGNAFVGMETPRLSELGHLYLSIKGDPAGLYDPDGGTLTGQAPLIGRPLWRTDQYVDPFLGNSNWPNRLEVTMTLQPGEDGVWTGTGQFQGAGFFCPQGEMAGMGQGADDYIGGVVGGMFDGAEVKGVNPEIFHQHQVIFGFSFEMTMPEADADDHTRLVVGAPAHGLMSRTTGLHVYESQRQSPVLLDGPMEQMIKIRMKSENAAIHLPAPVSLINDAGEFSVTATEADGWITLERELKIASKAFPPEMWPMLRALLLEEGDALNGTIVLD